MTFWKICGATRPYASLRAPGVTSWDLKSAYKQLARHPDDSWASILAVWNLETSTVNTTSRVHCSFGSICAVMAFNQMVRALRLIFI